jgi:hypothetical protein
MIDVVIYADPEDMSASSEDLEHGYTKTTTDIKTALQAEGFNVGLVSMRVKDLHANEYHFVVSSRL